MVLREADREESRPPAASAITYCKNKFLFVKKKNVYA
jgi:hypothetical protein